MFKNLFGNKDKENAEREAGMKSAAFNSLIPDQHVNPEAAASQKVFHSVQDKAKSMKLTLFRIRGLLVQSKMEDGPTLCKVEVLCF